MAYESKIHSNILGKNLSSLKITNPDSIDSLYKVGIGIDSAMYEKIATMDALTPTITTGSVTTPVQFLQSWLPGFVETTTKVRAIDEIAGIMTAGDWADEEVVQSIMEVTGTAIPYGDMTNVPLSSWNVNFERRSIVQFEEGMRVGVKEEERASKMRANAADAKRRGASLSLEIQRNQVGFLGYNSGANRTYGLLNDPSIGSYVTASTGTSTFTTWSTKTFLEITGDIRTAVAALRQQSGGLIDAYKTDTTLTIATSSVDYLSTTSDFGISVQDWIQKTYNGHMRITSAPQFDGANGGANVFYLFADKTDDDSTDGGLTFVQVVPSRFRVIGMQKLAKGYEEVYSNATAGVMCKRPWAVVRYTGI